MMCKKSFAFGFFRLGLLLVFLIQVMCLSAKKIQVHGLPHINQLPTHIINTVFQDSQGYIWYGTQDGLCRDDGYSVQTFRNDFLNVGMALKSNNITSLAEDSVANRIWIGTNRGLYILDKQNNRITAFDNEDMKERYVDNILMASDGTAWISSMRILFRIERNGKLTRYPLECIAGAGKEFMLYEDRQGQLLLSLSGKGLYRWNKRTGKFSLFYPYADRISGIVQDKKHGYYWLASWEHSIIRLDPTNKDKSQRYVGQKLPTTVSGLTARTAMSIVQDDTFNYLWITSWSDLFVFQISADGTLEQIDTSAFLPQRNKALCDIIKDRKGNLWVTARDDNNFFITFGDENVQSYTIGTLEERIKWKPTIERLCKDDKNVFWMFQRRIGLCLYDAVKEQIRIFTDFEQVKEEPFLVISTLLKSPNKDEVWVAGEYTTKVVGLTQHNMEMSICEEIELSSVSGNPGYVFHLFEDRGRHLWIATNIGLYRYDTTSKKLTIANASCGNVTHMLQLADGSIWGIQDNGGLLQIGADGNITRHGQRTDFVSLTATSDGILWMATDKGEILSYDAKADRFRDFSETCGLKGNKINDVVAGHYDHIWILTSQELKEFNPRSGAFRTFNASTENIHFALFLPHSYYQDAEGTLFIGGIPGFVSLKPTQDMENLLHHVVPLITDVKVMGTSLFFNSDRKGESLQKVTIRPDEQNLEIHFSSLNYENTSQIRYAYRLSGVDQDWVYLPAGVNTAFYNKLEKGTYRFEVKTTDENGLWSDQVATLTIRRQPAPYETWWAYTLYLLLLLGAAYYLYQMVHNRIRLRHELDMRQLEQAKSEELNHAKLQFFTNITHELLTPLTIISASVENLKQQVPTHKDTYKVMTNNINRLIRLLQQILEFRKAETGNLQLKVSRGDLALFLQRCVDNFLPLTKQKGMTFSFDSAQQPMMAYFDPDTLDKIIYNLLSNAAKYSVPDENVNVTLASHPEREGFVLLTVKDNGPGISHEIQKDLFKRFYEGSHRQFNTIGTGIGLSVVHDLVQLHHGTITVESELGHGATFIISLPIEERFYKADEIDTCSSPTIPQSLTNAEPLVEDVEEPTEQPQSPKQKYNVLLVEDNEELLLLMEKILSSEYNVYLAHNGQEGLACLRQNEIHLVVTDVMMPVMDGIDLCRSIKGDFETSHIPVVLLTAKKQEEDRVEAYEAGADGFIGKPFSLSVLHARIGNLLATRERMVKNFKKQLVFEGQEMNYTSLDEDFLKRAIDCVHRHLDDPDFNQQQFISELNTTRSTSFRKLKALTGLSFPAFVSNIRMKAACQIMDEKRGVKISEVAYAVGYNDPRYFTATFKKEIGMSPMEYMEKFSVK